MGTAALIAETAAGKTAPAASDSWWDDGALTEFGAVLFASLPRSDQRRKGVEYLRGLLGVRGRRSIRNIAALLGGSATEQSLHHFVCSSTWDWAPVRRALARHLLQAVPPLAWVAQPMVIPKAGENSVGVDRQYVPEVGRVLNAQRAIGVWAASEHTSSPVNWRLYLPSSWLGDRTRRRQASIPEDLGARSIGDMTVDACLETAREWRLPPRPVVLDARNMDMPMTVRRFGEAGVPFLARINSTSPLAVTDPLRLGRGPAVQPAGRLIESDREAPRPVVWREAGEGSSTLHTSVVSALSVRLPRVAPGGPAARDLCLVGIGSGPRRRLGQLWLTDMTDAPLPTLVTWSRLPFRTERDFRQTTDRLGIRDFAGRSYGGWHRHVTLASAAHAVSVLGSSPKRP
ncbi:IS701 family transposase [Streptomyces kebangsaanensis]|uniref:IS701 family transposase n=1 Tax=Streptomyces kebangsaanensis TaxID=864058 RepID=A0ABW6KRM8_9ACTN